MPLFDKKDKSRYATFTRRSVGLGGGMALVFAVLAGRLYQLQIENGEPAFRSIMDGTREVFSKARIDYSETANTFFAPPIANGPSFSRPIFRILNAMICPRPISPSTFSAGTRTLSK